MGLRLPKAGKLDSCRSQLAVCKTLEITEYSLHDRGGHYDYADRGA